MSNKSILQSNNETLSANNLDLQSLIDQANALPDAGGVELPELSNEGSASDLMNGKELIDGDGNKVTGTFSIDSELSAQDDLIAQIQAAVDSLPEAGSGGSGDDVETCMVTVSTNNSLLVIVYSTIDANNKMTTAWATGSTDYTLIVAKGSSILIPVISTLPGYNISGDADFIETLSGHSSHRTMIFKVNGISTINCYDDD